MPILPDTPRSGAWGFGVEPAHQEPRTPTWGETLSAGFEMENTVVNALDLMARKTHPADPNFDLIKSLKDNQLWEDRDEYLGVESEAEFLDKRTRIEGERKNRETLAAAGWAGIASAVLAGTLDPTMFIPLLTPAKGAKAVAQSASLALLAAGIQESVLYTAQETRTPGEVGFSLAASTVLGGVLGGAASLLRKGELDKMASGMVGKPGLEAILAPIQPFSGEAVIGKSSVGAAQAVLPDAGRLKSGVSKLAFISPITRGIEQPNAPMPGGSPVLRTMTSQFGNAGLRQEGAARGIAAAPGGTIESIQKTFGTYVVKAVRGIDKHYSDYFYGSGAGPTVARNLRAQVGGMVSAKKLSKAEFREQVTLAIWEGAENPNFAPEVNALARQLDKDVFKPIYDEAKAVGLFREVPAEIVADKGYAMRIYNELAIGKNEPGFLLKLENHFTKKLEAEFAERLMKLKGVEKREGELVEDIQRPADEVKMLQEDFLAELEKLEEGRPQALVDIEDEIAELRKKASKTKDPAEKKRLLEQSRAIRESGGLPLQLLKEDRATIRRRLRNLTKSKVVLAAKQEKKFDRIDKLEQVQVNTLNRAARAARKFIEFMDKGSDREIVKGLKALRDQFEDAAQSFDKAEGRVVKMADEEGADFNELMALQDAQAGRVEKVNAALAKLDELQDFDKVAWRASVQEVIDEILAAGNHVNNRRALRLERMHQQAARLDPRLADERIAGIRARGPARRADFTESIRVLGAEDVDLEKGSANFRNFARDAAIRVKDKIMGARERVPIGDIIAAERGPVIARMLDIPSTEIAEFLEKDIERVMRTYVRSFSADIPMAKKFGSANGAEWFLKLADEEKNVKERLLTQVGKDGKPLSPEASAKETEKVTKFYADARTDLYALIERLRGVRGMPKDPYSWSNRGLRAMMNLNVLRLMGKVVISSVSDPGHIVMKHGLLNTMKDGFVPLVTNFKAVRMSQREAKLAGIALDPVLHSRAHAMYDIFDELKQGNKAEKFLEYATSKMGILGLFDYWTAAMKEISAGVVNTRLLDALDTTINLKGSAKRQAKARAYLASTNLSPEDAAVIWEQVTNGVGGGKVRGVWVPETEAWDVSQPAVRKAREAYRAALVGEVDRTIVTPGLERPLWMDQGPLWKAIGQFRSFGMSSTQRTLMTGLQQRDMAMVNGVMISLALGTLSYYLWAVSTGGKAYTEMLNAGPDKWADEAIARSGLLGVFDEMQRAASKIPLTQPYASFSGTRNTRREGGDLIEGILGPSFDIADTGSRVLSGVDDPTQSTVHAARTLVPFQNMFWLSQALDQIEKAIGAPERRQPQ